MMARQQIPLLLLLLTGIMATAAQQFRLSVSTEEVRLDVLVTDKGRTVAGLKASDFEVFDNGVLQEIQYSTMQKQTPVSIVLVFDMSSSVAGELLHHLKNAASLILSDLNSGDHVALIAFNNAVVLGSLPTANFEYLRQELNRIQPFGNSSLFDGIYAGLILTQLRPDPALLIVFSDGWDTFSWLTDKAVLEAAKRNDTVVYAVSPGRQLIGSAAVGRHRLNFPEWEPDDSFLGELTRSTGGAILKAELSADIEGIFRRILEEFRQSYTVTYMPRGVSESGWHKLNVRVKRSAARVRTRQGYLRGISGR